MVMNVSRAEDQDQRPAVPLSNVTQDQEQVKSEHFTLPLFFIMNVAKIHSYSINFIFITKIYFRFQIENRTS